MTIKSDLAFTFFFFFLVERPLLECCHVDSEGVFRSL